MSRTYRAEAGVLQTPGPTNVPTPRKEPKGGIEPPRLVYETSGLPLTY
jgi:hypothetical protein